MTAKQILSKWKKLETRLSFGEENSKILSAIKELYSLYDANMLSWLGGLFDSEIGGFYYSNSARDSDEFLPDIESTGQAIGVLEISGAISSYNDVPEWMRKRMAYFICSCEDSESGYFYNPQWSKDMADKKPWRRGRDLRWATELAEGLDFKLPYETAYARLKEKKNAEGSPADYLRSEEAFIEYMKSFDWTGKIRVTVHALASQFDQIRDAGLGDVMLKFIEGLQDKESGLWGEGADEVKRVKGVSGIVYIYSAMKTPIPNATKITEYIISSLKNIKDGDISIITGIWNALAKVVNLTAEYGTPEEKADIARLYEQHSSTFAGYIRETTATLRKFRKPDFSFSYTEKYSSSTSQGMPVAKAGSFEGDVNATILAIGAAEYVVRSMTLSKETIPVFSTDDFEIFLTAARK